MGKVKLAMDTKHNKYVAIKIINKKKLRSKLISLKVDGLSMLEREIAIMKKMDHPNIVKIYEVIDDDEKKKLYLILDFVEKGSLLSDKFFDSVNLT